MFLQSFITGMTCMIWSRTLLRPNFFLTAWVTNRDWLFNGRGRVGQNAFWAKETESAFMRQSRATLRSYSVKSPSAISKSIVARIDFELVRFLALKFDQSAVCVFVLSFVMYEILSEWQLTPFAILMKLNHTSSLVGHVSLIKSSSNMMFLVLLKNEGW